MSDAVRLDRKPEIHLGLDEQGLHFRMEAVLHGDGEDWRSEDVATYFMEIWESARHTAALHRQFGLAFQGAEPRTPERDKEGTRAAWGRAVSAADPAPPVDPPMPARAVLTVATPERPPVTVTPERQTAKDRRTGMSAAAYRAMTNREEMDILTWLWHRPDSEATKAQLLRQFASMAESTLNQRLDALRKQELVLFRKTPTRGNLNFGFYQVTDQGKERLSQRVLEGPSVHPLTAVLPITKGKTWLMMGGDATRERILSIEATFQLKEMRWPTFYDEQPIERRLREIERADVDLVLGNRWNRRYARHYQHKARECGKPFVMLTRGINPNQIAEQLRRQFIEHRGIELALAA